MSAYTAVRNKLTKRTQTNDRARATTIKTDMCIVPSTQKIRMNEMEQFQDIFLGIFSSQLRWNYGHNTFLNKFSNNFSE